MSILKKTQRVIVFAFMLFIVLAGIKPVSAASAQFTTVPSSGTYYVGRQFEVVININTDEGTTAADFTLQYDASRLQVIDMDSGTSGVQIQPGNLYPNYPSNANSVSGGEIKLTGFTADTNGVLQSGGTGWFGTVRFLVIGTAPAGTDLTFEFTGVGNTTDSNVSDVNGIDMLDGVTNGHYILLEDNTNPFFSDWNPAKNATGIPVSSNVVFRVNDNESGVDVTSITATVDGILYSYGDSDFSANCTTANYDVVPYCDITINPSNNFAYDHNIDVSLYAEDLAANSGAPPTVDHNSASDNYSFRSEFDVNPPYTDGNAPAKSGSGSGTETNITFHLKDDETGVDIDSVSIIVDNVTYTESGTNTFSYSGTPFDYFITIDPNYSFEEDEIIYVQVNARDQATEMGVASYNWLHENYWFRTADTEAPWVDRRIPGEGANSGITYNAPIIFHINDLGVGVDLSTVEVIVNNVRYTNVEFIYSGDSSDYLIQINAPSAGWGSSSPIGIGINACDFSDNCMTTNVYAFVRSSAQCPVCESCEESSDPTENEEESVQTVCPSVHIPAPRIVSDVAKGYKEKIEVLEFNEDTFNGSARVFWSSKIALAGDAIPNSVLKVKFDDENVFFMVPVDENGHWDLDLKKKEKRILIIKH